jgi:hypothetical protein
LRQGKRAEATEASKASPGFFSLQVCLTAPGSAECNRRAELKAQAGMQLLDPEPSYWFGTDLVLLGRADLALPLFKRSVDRGYCAYPALKTDHALKDLQSNPEFQQIVDAAKACQEKFLAERAQGPQ